MIKKTDSNLIGNELFGDIFINDTFSPNDTWDKPNQEWIDDLNKFADNIENIWINQPKPNQAWIDDLKSMFHGIAKR